MSVTICDVGPRDGLQNEPETFEPAFRAELVNRLAAAGLPRVEAASFVRADAVPQMAGRRGSRRGDRTPGRNRVLRAGAEREGLRAARRLRPRPRQLHARRNRELQRAQREPVARRGAGGGGERDRPVQAPGDADDQRCVRRVRSKDVWTSESWRRSQPASRRRRSSWRTRSASRPRSRCERSSEHTRAGRSPAQHPQHRLRERGRGARVRRNALRRILRRSRRLPLRATGDAATSRPRISSTSSDGEGVETGIDLDALVAASQWLEGALGRRLEGQVYRAGAWAGD